MAFTATRTSIDLSLMQPGDCMKSSLFPEGERGGWAICWPLPRLPLASSGYAPSPRRLCRYPCPRRVRPLSNALANREPAFSWISSSRPAALDEDPVRSTPIPTRCNPDRLSSRPSRISAFHPHIIAAVPAPVARLPILAPRSVWREHGYDLAARWRWRHSDDGHVRSNRSDSTRAQQYRARAKHDATSQEPAAGQTIHIKSRRHLGRSRPGHTA